MFAFPKCDFHINADTFSDPDQLELLEYACQVASENGSPYFNLKAANGQVIGSSEMYSSESARDAGIESVMANAAGASVDDQTAA